MLAVVAKFVSGLAVSRLTRAAAAGAVLLSSICARGQGLPIFRTDAVEPNHFVAVHGRKSVIMGYLEEGLEIWGYPFQILSHFRVEFRPAGTSIAVDGRRLLRRVDYAPDSITRTYVGPDYLIREKLFTPLDRAAATISYEVEGIRQVDIEVTFTPVLNLMWPGALGGQYTRWVEARPGQPDIAGFVISEPGRGFSASIGSAETISHSDTVNSAIILQSGVEFLMRPTSARKDKPAQARVYVALNPAGTERPLEALDTLSVQAADLEVEAAAHYQALEQRSIRIRTPNDDLNRIIAAAAVALDQAWVCNELLGCGIVAGYGPSRDARRPQYAWFFGGDGLVATNALISGGEYSRAREELSFVQKYQDAGTGMIWHELSQSAGFIDWSKFPYMYVHVDISFDYLSTLARYVSVSGDVAFAKERWPSIAAAYRYCLSQIGPDHLPHIPADKEASDEQHRPADDLGLAASWMAAASGFARLATLTHHEEQASGALEQTDAIRRTIPAHYWNAEKNFWFDGHTQSGEPIFRQAAGPTQLLVQDVFSPEQTAALLSRLASADFQADWGTREVAASSTDYNPYSYGAGSISALGASDIATTFWQAHRPETAWGIWSAIAQWGKLDSPGHIHEVLAGNFFHEETESVPEQTWSSAGFLDAAVRGLFGLTIDGVAAGLRFAPHIPPEWNSASIDNVRLPHSTLSFQISQSLNGLDLKITNSGPATTLTFEPQIPLGVESLTADFNGHAAPVQVTKFPGDEHATLTLRAPPGDSLLSMRFQGGVSISPDQPDLHVGDVSTHLKVVAVSFHSRVLSLDLDLGPGSENKLLIRTPWSISRHVGAKVQLVSPAVYEVTFDKVENSPAGPYGYTRRHFELAFSN